MENKETKVDSGEKEIQIYEVGYHIIPTVAEDHLGAEVSRVREAIEGHGGLILGEEYPKNVDLAYPMVKVFSNKRTTYHTAHFGWIKYQNDPGQMKAVDAALKADESLLRFIVVKTVRENTMAPKKVFTPKHDEAPRSEEKAEEKPPMSEEELDKTIEELVIN